MGCHYYCVRVSLSWTSERPAEPMYRDEYLHFGEGEGGAACLCTFPGNDGEALDPDRLRSLAFLGAGVVLASGQAIQGDGDSPNFLPDCLPEWLVREIHRLVPDQSVIRDCQPDRESGGEAPQMVAAGIACDDKSRRATAELRREVEDLEALVAWIKEDPSRLGGDGWAEQCWWEERRQAGRSETPSATRPMAELGSEALFTDRPKDRTCRGVYDDKDRRIDVLEADLRVALGALQRLRARWIPVSEQLPGDTTPHKNRDALLVRLAQGPPGDSGRRRPVVELAGYIPLDLLGPWLRFRDGEPLEGVTHWMPIPPLPETET